MARRMIRFGTLGVVRFGAGEVLALTPEQAAPRSAMLEEAGKGLWRVSGGVEFKAGEEIGLKVEGDLPRYLDGRLQQLRGGKAKMPDARTQDGDNETGSFPPEIMEAIRQTAEKQGIGDDDSPSLDGVNAALALAGIERLFTAPELTLAWAEIRAADAAAEADEASGGHGSRD